MSKLFDKVDEQTAIGGYQGKMDFSVEMLSDFLHVTSSDLKNTESLARISLEQMSLSTELKRRLDVSKIGSKEYFTSLESDKCTLEILSKRMGVVRFPAMEDIKNPYALNASKTLALEGYAEFWKKSWENFKKFMKELFKKILLLIKRIVGANLGLKEYEDYNDQLINKLKQLNAKITDNTPINTKLGQLLADEDQEKVDSDFILNQGLQKFRNLVSLLENITGKTNDFFQVKDLTKILDTLKQQIKAYNYLGIDSSRTESIGHLEEHLKTLASNVITGAFTYIVPSVRTLPSEVYEKLFDDFDSASVRDGKVEVQSLVQIDGYNAHLPKDLNLFLAHQDHTKFFITGYKQESKYTQPQVKPIEQLSNLVRLNDEYKRKYKSIDLGDCVKALNDAEDVIGKILDVLSGEFITLADKGTKGENYEGLMRAFIQQLRERKVTFFHFQDTYSQTPEYVSLNRQHSFEDSLINLLGFANQDSMLPHEYEQLARWYENDRPGFKMTMEYLAKVLNIDMQNLQTDSIDEFTLANYQKFQELNMYLSHVFSKLQTIYRTIVSDIFGMYTEVRFELVRYIYESARRYSY